MIRENEALLDRLNIVTDLAVLFLSIVLSYTVRFHIFDSTENHLLLSYYLLFVLALLPIYYLIFSTFDLICVFRTRTFSEEVVKLIQANHICISFVPCSKSQQCQRGSENCENCLHSYLLSLLRFSPFSFIFQPPKPHASLKLDKTS